LPSRHHFRISAGEDRTLSLTARGSGGAILDLTTYSISWSMAHTKGGAPVLQKTGTVVSAVAGTFTISLTDSDTNLLKAGTYFHQALATAGATTLNVAEGNIQVSLENTGVLQSSLGMSYDGTQFYSTKAQAALARINLSVPFVWTAGLNSAGDGQGQLYKRVSAQPAHSQYFQSADGAYWESASWGYSGGDRGPFVDTGDGSSIWRLADRLFVGGGGPADGTTTGGNTYVGSNVSSAVMGAQYVERSATLFSASSYGGIGVAGATRHSDQYTSLGYSVWTSGEVVSIGAKRGYLQNLYVAASAGTTGASGPSHTSGTVSDGAVNWTFVDYTYQTPIAVVGILLNDISDGAGAWANYFEAQRGASGGTTYAMEVAVKNRGGDVTNNPYDKFPGGATIGTWFAGGADDTYGGAAANPSTCAIVIGENAQPWNKGIVFTAEGLTGSDGATGTATAIAMAKGHIISWHVTGGGVAASIRSDATASAQRVTQIFQDDGLWFLARDAFMVRFSNSAGGAPVNYLDIISSATTVAPSIAAEGTDTDIDLKLTPKGAGTVKFGTHTGSGDAAVNGYITIKDAAGNTRKLATIA
jgi:hypothetical protein